VSYHACSVEGVNSTRHDMLCYPAQVVCIFRSPKCRRIHEIRVAARQPGPSDKAHSVRTFYFNQNM
jgi:hypothetical protein